MESRIKTSGVIRSLRPLAGSSRYYPYSPVVSGKKKMKEAVVRLGVELSLHVAQSMFLLCDDIGKMLGFCYRLFRNVTPLRNPVLDRLLRVMHYVYLENIKPKKKGEDDCGNFDQDRVFTLIRAAWKNFGYAIIILSRLYLALSSNVGGFDDRQISCVTASLKQCTLKKLEDKFRDVNGFARETIESNIFDLWKSLFDEEAKEDKEAAQVVLSSMFIELFTPLDKMGRTISGADIPGLVRIPPPFILSGDFTTHEAKVEVVRLGVELCLYVAQSMFLLCDDIRTLLGFCNGMWIAARRADVINESRVVDRLLLVMHHVYLRYIEPKKGVYDTDGEEPVQFESLVKAATAFIFGIKHLASAAHSLRGGTKCGREVTRPVEKMVKKVEKKLGLMDKGVAGGNGFDRDAIEPDVLEIWKSLFDVEAKEATPTLQAIKSGILTDLFQPVYDELAAEPQQD